MFCPRALFLVDGKPGATRCPFCSRFHRSTWISRRRDFSERNHPSADVSAGWSLRRSFFPVFFLWRIILFSGQTIVPADDRLDEPFHFNLKAPVVFSSFPFPPQVEDTSGSEKPKIDLFRWALFFFPPPPLCQRMSLAEFFVESPPSSLFPFFRVAVFPGFPPNAMYTTFSQYS